MDACQRFLPAWIAHYRRERLATDLVAGLVVGILVIPQSLAYALLAGLPPQAGLYAGIFPVIVYAWIGSSMTQAVGPVAITAIMTFSLLSPLAAPASPHYLQLAAWLALISGLMVLAFGLLRLGFLAQLLSRPVVSGFISGSAVLIALSQIKPLLGLPGGGRPGGLRDLLAQPLAHANPLTLVIAGLSLVILLFSRRALPGYSSVPAFRKRPPDSSRGSSRSPSSPSPPSPSSALTSTVRTGWQSSATWNKAPPRSRFNCPKPRRSSNCSSPRPCSP